MKKGLEEILIVKDNDKECLNSFKKNKNKDKGKKKWKLKSKGKKLKKELCNLCNKLLKWHLLFKLKRNKEEKK